MASSKKGEVSEVRVPHNNEFGIVGVVFGILSVFSLSAGGVVMGIIGLVFSMKQKKRHPNQWSKAGVILNTIGIILGIVATILFITFSEEIAGLLI